jgi:hypothetical protein
MEFLWFKQGKFEYPSNMSPGLVGERYHCGIGHASSLSAHSLWITPLLAALLRKVLVCDPNCRATIEEIQQDEWFQEHAEEESEEEEEWLV